MSKRRMSIQKKRREDRKEEKRQIKNEKKNKRHIANVESKKNGTR